VPNVRFSLVVSFVALIASACGSGGESTSESSPGSSQPPMATTVAVSTTEPPETTTTMPPTTTATIATTTTVYFAATESLYPPESMASDGASGSGCAPGAGALPSGVWFGYVNAGDPSSLQFDLACWYFGELAWDVADGYGETAENDYYVVNQNPTLRTVPVSGDTVVHHIDPASIGHDPISYLDWLLEPPGYLECPFGFCPLWLFVNEGEVTEILEQYVP